MYLVFYNEATLISVTDIAHTMLACSRDKHHHYYYKPADDGSQCDMVTSAISYQNNNSMSRCLTIINAVQTTASHCKLV